MGWKKKAGKILRKGRKMIETGAKIANAAAPVITGISTLRSHSEKSDNKRPTR
jgi:hypothetical protein